MVDVTTFEQDWISKLLTIEKTRLSIFYKFSSLIVMEITYMLCVGIYICILFCATNFRIYFFNRCF